MLELYQTTRWVTVLVGRALGVEVRLGVDVFSHVIWKPYATSITLVCAGRVEIETGAMAGNNMVAPILAILASIVTLDNNREPIGGTQMTLSCRRIIRCVRWIRRIPGVRGV